MCPTDSVLRFSSDAGFVIDYIGRRAAIIANAIVFILGAIVLSLSPNFATLVRAHLRIFFFKRVGVAGHLRFSFKLPTNKQKILTLSLAQSPISPCPTMPEMAAPWPHEACTDRCSCLLQVVGRLVVGYAVSLSATAECVYISEISPAVSQCVPDLSKTGTAFYCWHWRLALESSFSFASLC